MPRSFNIRRAADADLPAILRLMDRGLGSPETRPRTGHFWRWKHSRQPFGPSIVFVAESAGAGLVGLRALMRWRFREPGHSDEDWEAVRAGDTVTHPAYRRQGIFAAINETALTAAREEGVDFVFNPPNATSAAGYRKQGWVDGGKLPLRLRPVRLGDLATAGFRFSRRAQRQAVRQWRPEGLPPVVEEDAEALAADASGLEDRQLESSVSAAFYRWRFAGTPTSGTTRSHSRPLPGRWWSGPTSVSGPGNWCSAPARGQPGDRRRALWRAACERAAPVTASATAMIGTQTASRSPREASAGCHSPGRGYW